MRSALCALTLLALACGGEAAGPTETLTSGYYTLVANAGNGTPPQTTFGLSIGEITATTLLGSTIDGPVRGNWTVDAWLLPIRTDRVWYTFRITRDGRCDGYYSIVSTNEPTQGTCTLTKSS